MESKKDNKTETEKEEERKHSQEMISERETAPNMEQRIDRKDLFRR